MTAKGLMRVSTWGLFFSASLVMLGQVLAQFPLGQVTSGGMWWGVVLGGTLVSVLMASLLYGIGAAIVARMARSQPQPAVQPAATMTAQPVRPAQNGRMVYNATTNMGAMQ